MKLTLLFDGVRRILKDLDLIRKSNSGFRFDKLFLKPKPNVSSVAFRCTESIHNILTFPMRN